MTETTLPESGHPETPAGIDADLGSDETRPNASAHFAAAVEQAKAGAQVLGKQAQDQAEAYRNKLTQQTGDLTDKAKARGDEVVGRAMDLAADGKTRASAALLNVGKMVSDNASVVDERASVHYGDYVRTAGQSIQEFAEKLDNKDFDELTAQVKAFVRERPGVSIGIAAMSGFFLSRLFSSSKD